MKIQLLLCLTCFCMASAIGQTPVVIGSYVSTSGQADAQRNNSLFSYTAAGTPWNGTLLTVGGFNIGSYPLQLNADYGPNGGNHLSFRTRTDDAGAHWNNWYEIFHSGNLSKPDVDFTCKNLSVNGMVGIGATANWQLTVKDVIALSGNNNQQLHIRPNSGYGGYIYWAENGIAERGILGFNAGSGDLVYRSGASNLTNGTERFRIAANGNVGIGTTSATTKLVLQGTKKISFNTDRTAVSGIREGTSLSYTGNMTLFSEDGKTGEGFDIEYWNGSTYYSSFQINHVSSGFGSLFLMKDGGNVGIGTSNPQNKLDVNGTIRAKEVKVETGWADFVFTPTYKLRPLCEVEQFIKTNGHLPEIPKAEEVQQNGVNLGEMQTKLLQKVEELTLYMIEQQKLIEKQKLEIDELRKCVKNNL